MVADGELTSVLDLALDALTLVPLEVSVAADLASGEPPATEGWLLGLLPWAETFVPSVDGSPTFTCWLVVEASGVADASDGATASVLAVFIASTGMLASGFAVGCCSLAGAEVS